MENPPRLAYRRRDAENRLGSETGKGFGGWELIGVSVTQGALRMGCAFETSCGDES